MTIIEAVTQVLSKTNKSLSAKQIYNKIIENNLYQFSTNNPIHIVNTQIRRHCVGVELAYTKNMKKIFNIDKKGNFSLLQSKVDSSNKNTLISELYRIHNSLLDQTKNNILNQLTELTPIQFEEFSRIFLLEFGFEDMFVTKVSRDGGIDGYGKLKVGLEYFNVAFQSKKWSKNKIPRKEIDAFRGSIQGKYEQGIFFTTSQFTTGAKSVSVVPGAVPIVLVDGSSLTDYMIENEIGVKLEQQLPLFSLTINQLFEKKEKLWL